MLPLPMRSRGTRGGLAGNGTSVEIVPRPPRVLETALARVFQERRAPIGKREGICARPTVRATSQSVGVADSMCACSARGEIAAAASRPACAIRVRLALGWDPYRVGSLFECGLNAGLHPAQRRTPRVSCARLAIGTYSALAQ